uniref:Uncharacterized protein n=1 Tax=Oryza barthii TaxID=65489 RepID=A0A0D3H681_9ORYZ
MRRRWPWDDEESETEDERQLEALAAVSAERKRAAAGQSRFLRLLPNRSRHPRLTTPYIGAIYGIERQQREAAWWSIMEAVPERRFKKLKRKALTTEVKNRGNTWTDARH